MSRRLVVDVFVEDHAHEVLLLAMLRRLTDSEGCQVQPRIRSARGGHGKAIDEMRRVQEILQQGMTGEKMPDLFLVGIDGNCTTSTEKRREIREQSLAQFGDLLVIACPDPHIERWFMADPDSFHTVVGVRPNVGKEKCRRDHYVQMLAAAVREAGNPATLGGIEFADELVAAMDLYRAAKNDAALGLFLDDLRAALRAAK